MIRKRGYGSGEKRAGGERVYGFSGKHASSLSFIAARWLPVSIKRAAAADVDEQSETMC
jgi:hypothetical protein